jgi:hypothetical protein
VEKTQNQEGEQEQALDRLVLDIKSLMLLAESSASLEALIDRKLVGSHDEHVEEFLRLVQPQSKSTARGNLLVAAAELVLASFLIIAGLVTVLPAVVGFTSPEQLVVFIGQITSRVSLQTLSDPVVPALELLLAVALLLGAFHTVRLAATNLERLNAAH